jgi:hypothetical protein
MPTYLLEGTNEIVLEARPLRIALRLEGVGGEEAWLNVTAGGRAVDSVVRPPSMVILPSVHTQTMVSVVPVGHERFPSATIAHLSVVVEDRQSADPQRAVVVPIDVSGLDHKDLISIEPASGGLLLKAAQSREDADLGALGNAARVAAREHLGVQCLDGSEAVQVRVVVDGSGSTAHPTATGATAAVVDLLCGVSQVISHGNSATARLLGRERGRSFSAGFDAMGAAVDAELGKHVSSIGFRSALSSESDQAGNTRSVTYILTDSVPADIRELETNAASPNSKSHIVAITSQRVWDLLGGTTLPSTVIEPKPGLDLSTNLLEDATLLRQTVASLLTGSLYTHANGERTGR